jgi:hypothetical protein
LGATLVVNHGEYYKGEGGGFPQVGAMMGLLNLCMFMVCPCIKNIPIIH